MLYSEEDPRSGRKSWLLLAHDYTGKLFLKFCFIGQERGLRTVRECYSMLTRYNTRLVGSLVTISGDWAIQCQ
jgi:hypothetical protein